MKYLYKITDTRLNSKFTHAIGDILDVVKVDGAITEYQVGGVTFWTWTRNVKKYSEPI